LTENKGSPMSIQFHCPGCETLLETASDMANAIVKCPYCQKDLHVPGATPASAVAVGRQAPPPEPRSGFRCPFCRSSFPPELKRKVSVAGWVTFGVLFVLCLPLCFIGLFIKDDYRVCRSCGIKLG
jgi:transposase-like protein